MPWCLELQHDAAVRALLQTVVGNRRSRAHPRATSSPRWWRRFAPAWNAGSKRPACSTRSAHGLVQPLRERRDLCDRAPHPGRRARRRDLRGCARAREGALHCSCCRTMLRCEVLTHQALDLDLQLKAAVRRHARSRRMRRSRPTTPPLNGYLGPAASVPLSTELARTPSDSARLRYARFLGRSVRRRLWIGAVHSSRRLRPTARCAETAGTRRLCCLS